MKSAYLTKSNRIDYILSFIVLFQLIIVTLQQLLPLLGMPEETVAGYRIIITLITYIPGVICILKRGFNKMMVVFFAYGLLLLINYGFFPESTLFITSKEAITLTPIMLLTILFISCIVETRIFFKVLLYISRLALIVSFVYVVVHTISPLRDINNTYSMSFGYSMLLPAMFLFVQSSILDRIYSLVLFVLILLAGSRGPVGVLLLFYLYFVVLRTSFKTKISLIILITFMVMIAIKYLPELEVFETSRTIAVLNTSGDLRYDSGREDEMYSVVRPKIMEHPLIGWGIGSDRYFLHGIYCHNVFLELYVHYGVIWGTIILLTLLHYLVKLFFSYRIKKTNDGRIIIVLFFLYGFFPLIVSGSYLSSFNFGVFIGIITLLYKAIKDNSNYNCPTFGLDCYSEVNN